MLARVPRALSIGFLALPVSLVFGVAATRTMADPDAFYWHRYVVAAMPWLYVIAGVGFGASGALLVDLVRRPQGQSAGALIPDPVMAAIMLAVTLLPFAGVTDGLTTRLDRYAANVRDVDAINVRSGRWLGEHAESFRGAVVATQDAGAVRYFAPRDTEILDLLGLNDHELVTAGLEGDIGPYLTAQQPSAMLLLDPDPGAVPFMGLAQALSLEEVARFGVPEYSLFDEPGPKALVLLANRRP